MLLFFTMIKAFLLVAAAVGTTAAGLHMANALSGPYRPAGFQDLLLFCSAAGSSFFFLAGERLYW